nr:MAG: hypothetical protein ADFBMEEK_00085 [Peromyscus leucopus gammaherpesvirus]
MQTGRTFLIICLLIVDILGSYGRAVPSTFHATPIVLGYVNASAPEIFPVTPFKVYKQECNYQIKGTADILSLKTGEAGVVLPVSQLSPLTVCMRGSLEISAPLKWNCLPNISELVGSMRIIGSTGIPHNFTYQKASSGEIRLSSTFKEHGNGTFIIISRTLQSFKCLDYISTKFIDQTPLGWCSTWFPKWNDQTSVTYQKTWNCAFQAAHNPFFMECIKMIYQQNTTERILYTGNNDHWKTSQKSTEIIGMRVVNGANETWIWRNTLYENLVTEILLTEPIEPFMYINDGYTKNYMYQLKLLTVNSLDMGPTLVVAQQITNDNQCLPPCAFLLNKPVQFEYTRGMCRHLDMLLFNPVEKTVEAYMWNTTFFSITLIHAYNVGGEEMVLLDPKKLSDY